MVKGKAGSDASKLFLELASRVRQPTPVWIAPTEPSCHLFCQTRSEVAVLLCPPTRGRERPDVICTSQSHRVLSARNARSDSLSRKRAFRTSRRKVRLPFEVVHHGKCLRQRLPISQVPLLLTTHPPSPRRSLQFNFDTRIMIVFSRI